MARNTDSDEALNSNLADSTKNGLLVEMKPITCRSGNGLALDEYA